MTKQIATHNKIFHADEVTAVALLELFTDDEIVVKRVDHDTRDFDRYDMVIDIGRRFDGVKYFDHHQYKGGKSSAGLIWDYLGVAERYPKIDKLIKLVDDNDTGVAKAKPFEYSSLIKCFNTEDIYGEEQDRAFGEAVAFAKRVLSSFRRMDEQIEEAGEVVAYSYPFEGRADVLELERFTPHWGHYINGEEMPHIKAVVWEDETEGVCKVKLTSQKPGSFDTVAKPLPQDESMNFVHSAGFFAVAPDRETMREYLKRSIK